MASEEDRRAQASSLKARRDFTRQAISFAVVGLILILIWFLTTRDTDDAFFWPIFPLVAMGVPLTARGVTVFRTKPASDDKPPRRMDADGYDDG